MNKEDITEEIFNYNPNTKEYRLFGRTFTGVNAESEFFENLYNIYKENERLNNVINELEKALKSHQYIKINAHYGEYYVEIDEVLNFIKKLKEGK